VLSAGQRFEKPQLHAVTLRDLIRTGAVALGEDSMEMLAQAMPFAAIGYSLVYLLAGGGLFGAVVIFIIAKMLGK